MEKGYYTTERRLTDLPLAVAIHNKNGKGLLHFFFLLVKNEKFTVAIHNKNGKGLLPILVNFPAEGSERSQSTIKMEKGYYCSKLFF